MRTASETNYTLRALVLAVPMDLIAVVTVVLLLLLVPLLLKAAAEGWRDGGDRRQHQAGGWTAAPFRHILRRLLRRRRRLPLLRLLLRLLLPRPETFAVVAGEEVVRLAGAGGEGMTPRMGQNSARERQVGEGAVVVVVVVEAEVEAAAATLEGTLAFSAGEEEREKAVVVRSRSMPSTA